MKEATIKINIDASKATKSVDDLNKALKINEEEVKSLKQQYREAMLAAQELGSAEVVDEAAYNAAIAKAGQLKDAINDTNEQINIMAGGSKFERIGNAFGDIGSKLKSLDFEGAAQSARNLSAMASKISFADAASSAKNLGSTFAQLGKALLTNPLFLIGAAIAAIGYAFYKLMERIGLVKVITDALGKAFKVIEGVFESVALAIGKVTDALGLTTMAANDAAKAQISDNQKVIDSYNEKADAIAKSSAFIKAIQDNDNRDSAVYLKQEELQRKKQISLLDAVVNKTKAQKEELNRLRLEDLDGEIEANNSRFTDAMNYLRLEKSELKKQKEEEQKILEAYASNEGIALAKYRASQSDEDKKAYNDAKVIKDKQASIHQELIRKEAILSEEGATITREFEVKKTEILIQQKVLREQIRQQAIAEERKQLLTQITDTYARTKEANKQLSDLTIAEQKDLQAKELALTQSTYLEKLNKIIEPSIKKELDALDEKLLQGLLSEKQYETKRDELYTQGYKTRLTKEETLLIESLNKQNQSIKEAIAKRFSDEAKISKENAEVLNAERTKIVTEYNKQLELLNAESEKDEIKKLENIKAIKAKYLNEEISNIQKLLTEQEKALKLQYDIDIADTSLTAEKKLEIEAQYQLNLANLRGEALIAQKQLETESIDSFTNTIAAQATKLQTFLQTYQQSVTSTLQTLQMAWQLAAEAQAAANEYQYTKDNESLKSALAEKLLTQEQYNKEVALLEQKKANLELEAKRRAFKQNKALAIVNATMQAAQATTNALASAPPPANFVIAGITAGLAAIQIGLISSQTFKAAKGGIVPKNGQLSTQDSVPSLLAPGEIVINSNSSKKFAPLLSAINEAGGGQQLVPDVSFANKQNISQPVYQQQQTVKAVVVESELSQVQSRVARYKENNRF